MSLTSHLDDPQDKVTRFIRERFPNNRPIGRQFLTALDGAKVLESPSGVAAGTMGTAFDWRVRFMFKQPPDLHLAELGMLFYSHKPGTVIDLDQPNAIAWPQELFDAIRTGQYPSAEWLNRCCVLLALLTEFYRAGWYPEHRLLSLGQNSTLADALALVNEAECTDLAALISLAETSLPKSLWSAGPVTLGPTFDGSALIGGADADLICGGALVELKTAHGNRKGLERRLHLGRTNGIDQLIGYVLLDFSDTYRINSVAVYAARWGRFVRWPLTEFLETLADESIDLAEERAEFAALLGTLKEDAENEESQPVSQGDQA